MELRTLYIERQSCLVYIQFPNATYVQLYILWRMLFYIGWTIFRCPKWQWVAIMNGFWNWLLLLCPTYVVSYFLGGMSTFDGKIRNVFWKYRLKRLELTLGEFKTIRISLDIGRENRRKIQKLNDDQQSLCGKFKTYEYQLLRLGYNLKDTTSLWLFLLLLSL